MPGPSTIDSDACIAGWCAGEEWCAIACTMHLLGKKWHPVIIDHLLEHEPLRFNQFQNQGIDITNKVLSESLHDLEAKKLVKRVVITEKPIHVEYSLTDHGRSLAPVIEALETWGTNHLHSITAEDSPCRSSVVR